MKRHHFTTELAEALEVSRSGWDMHTRKEQRPRRRQDRQLSAALKPLFIENRRTYGSPRLTRCLHRQGQRCGKNRIARLMRELGLRACQKRRFRPQTTHSGHGLSVAANWLARVPTPDRLNQIWIADITYLPTTEGWLYLAGILDLYSRRLAGWAMSEHIDTPLILAAWGMAQTHRQPPAGLVFHSDRGVQYASLDAPRPPKRPGHRLHEPQSQLLRQCRHGILLEHPQTRTHLPPPLQNSRRGPPGDL